MERACLVLALLVGCTVAQEYNAHDKVPVLVNNVGPFNNPVEAYPFYSMPFCAPKEETAHAHHFGEVIAGKRMSDSLYDVRFKVDVQWQALCRFQLSQDEIKQFIEAIKDHYIFEMLVDHLPVKGFVGEMETVSTVYDHHTHNKTKHYLFTHLDFSIAYNENNVIAVNLTTDPDQRLELEFGNDLEVEFSFGIHWHYTPVKYDQRIFMHAKSLVADQAVEIHWLSIINSFVLVVLLVAFLAIILTRVLKKDVARYMEIDEEDFDDQADSGWKLVHGDVFRFPERPMLLSAMVGTGAQLTVLVCSIMLLSLVGFFYPGNEGGLYLAAVLLYALTACIAGYVSTSMYVQMGGTKWATNAVLTACIFAVPFFAVFAVLNTVAIAYSSQVAMPFGTILIVLLIWAVVTFPLTVLGSMRGRTPEPYDAPCKTNRAAREIPPVPAWRAPAVIVLTSGFLPFSAIYIELHYIFASIYGHRVYTLYEILALALVLLVLVTASIAIALTYFQLVSEDYHWWWRSFFSGCSTGVFMYAYAIFYFYHRSEMSGFLQGTFFFGYVGAVCYGFALMLGSISFMTSQKFVRYIYGSIKID